VITVGRLFRARGNRGELTGEIYSSQPGRAEKLKDVTLELADGKTRPSRVEEIWWHDGRPVFKFAGIDSISDAEPWAGAAVLVDDSERELSEEGAYSYADLRGCDFCNRVVKAGVLAITTVLAGEAFVPSVASAAMLKSLVVQPSEVASAFGSGFKTLGMRPMRASDLAGMTTAATTKALMKGYIGGYFSSFYRPARSGVTIVTSGVSDAGARAEELLATLRTGARVPQA